LNAIFTEKAIIKEIADLLAVSACWAMLTKCKEIQEGEGGQQVLRQAK